MPSSLPPFRFRNFSFSLTGRMARLQFLVVIAICYGLFIGLIHLWNQYLTIRVLMNGAIMAVFTVKYLANIKRLHDLGLPALTAAPTPILTLWIGYNNFVVTYLGTPRLDVPGTLSIFHETVGSSSVVAAILLLMIALSDLALVFVPGTRGANRYGGDGRTSGEEVVGVF